MAKARADRSKMRNSNDFGQAGALIARTVAVGALFPPSSASQLFGESRIAEAILVEIDYMKPSSRV